MAECMRCGNMPARDFFCVKCGKSVVVDKMESLIFHHEDGKLSEYLDNGNANEIICECGNVTFDVDFQKYCKWCKARIEARVQDETLS